MSQEGYSRSALFERFSVDFMEDAGQNILIDEEKVVDSTMPIPSKTKKELKKHSSENTFFEKFNLKVLPLNKLPPGQAVSSIAKICDNILLHFKWKEQLKFRLISRNWRQNFTNTLLANKFWHVCIEQNSARNQNEVSVESLSVQDILSGSRLFKRGTLEEFTELLDATGNNTFCSSFFVIDSTNLSEDDSVLQTFLYKHGHRIKKIRLRLTYIRECSQQLDSVEIDEESNDKNDDESGDEIDEDIDDENDGESDDEMDEEGDDEIDEESDDGNDEDDQERDARNLFYKCGEDWVHQFVKRLLVEQVPNLEELKIEFCFSPYTRTKGKSPLLINQEEKPEEKQIISSTSHSKLKILRLERHISYFPPSILDLICDLCPKLLRLDTENYNLYLEPKNRLHLLKDFTFEPYSVLLDDLDYDAKFISKVLNMEGKFQLTKLYLEMTDFEAQASKAPIEVCSFMADFINKLLQKCCNSLEDFSFTSLKFFSGLQIPQMPKVTNVDFVSVYIFGTDFLPHGTHMREVFPNLKSVRFRRGYCSRFRDPNTGYIFDVLDSVKIGRKDDTLLGDMNAQRLQQLFPNAKTHFKSETIQLSSS